MFEFERYSSLNKALRVVAYVLRFISKARKIIPESSELSPNELKVAKQHFFKLLQFQHFRQEIVALKGEKKLSRDSKLSKLSPFLDKDGIMRVSGRIQLSDLAYETKHPIIPPKCHGSLLLVRSVHVSRNHAGVFHDYPDQTGL